MDAVSRTEGASAPTGARCIYCGGSSQPLTLTVSSALRAAFHAACRDRHASAKSRPPSPVSVLLVLELRDLGRRTHDPRDAAVVEEAVARLEERISEGRAAR